MGRAKISTFTGIWKKLIPTLRDNFEKAQDFNGEVIADMIEVTGELKLEVEVEDVVELLQS